MQDMDHIAHQHLKVHCAKIETLLNKTYEQFQTRHMSQKMSTIGLDYIKDTRQVYRILNICEDELCFYLEALKMDFMGNTLKVLPSINGQLLSKFNMLLISQLLRCFTEPTSEIQQIEYKPRKFDMQVLSNHDYPIIDDPEYELQMKKQVILNERLQEKEEQYQIKNLNLLISQCLNEREKINSLGSSGASEQIYQTIQNLRRWRQIGNAATIDKQGDDYLKYYDGAELIYDLTEKMKRNLKMRKTENTERLIGKMLHNYNQMVTQKLEQMGQDKETKQTQTQFSDSYFEVRCNELDAQLKKSRLLNTQLTQEIETSKDTYKKQEIFLIEMKQQAIIDKMLFKQLDAELDHKIQIILYLQEQLQLSLGTVTKETQVTNMNEVSERFLDRSLTRIGKKRSLSEHKHSETQNKVSVKRHTKAEQISYSLPRVLSILNSAEKPQRGLQQPTTNKILKKDAIQSIQTQGTEMKNYKINNLGGNHQNIYTELKPQTRQRTMGYLHLTRSHMNSTKQLLSRRQSTNNV